MLLPLLQLCNSKFRLKSLPYETQSNAKIKTVKHFYSLKVDPKETEILYKDRLTDFLSSKYTVQNIQFDAKTESLTAKVIPK